MLNKRTRAAVIERFIVTERWRRRTKTAFSHYRSHEYLYQTFLETAPFRGKSFMTNTAFDSTWKNKKCPPWQRERFLLIHQCYATSHLPWHYGRFSRNPRMAFYVFFCVFCFLRFAAFRMFRSYKNDYWPSNHSAPHAKLRALTKHIGRSLYDWNER